MILAKRTTCTVCSCFRRVNFTATRVYTRTRRLWKEMKRSADGGGVMLRHLRYREKLAELGGQLEPPGSIELAVIGSGVNGTPKSFVINTDHIRRVSLRTVAYGVDNYRKLPIPKTYRKLSDN